MKLREPRENAAVRRTMLVAALLVAPWSIADVPAAGQGQPPASEQTSAPETLPAVLKQHEIHFVYRSSVSYLSCSELQGGVAAILRALGARDDIDVRVSECDAVVTPSDSSSDRWSQPTDRDQAGRVTWGATMDMGRSNSRMRSEQNSHVRIRVMMPVEVTPAVLAEMDRDKSRRELISHVTGDPSAAMNDAIVFPAQRQPVKLSRRTIGLEPGDCHLLEQMSRSVFRRLNLRVTRSPSCGGRDQLSRIPPQATVEALMPVIPRAPQIEPASETSEPDPTRAPEAQQSDSSEPKE